MDRPPAILTQPAPDRGELRRVRKQEPEIVAHIWTTHTHRSQADDEANEQREKRSRCRVCMKPGPIVVGVVQTEIKAGGATAPLFAVVLRHLRAED